MHIDSRLIDDNTVLEGDICIIGAGVCGISMALQLSDTPYKVILLEGGGFEYDPTVQALYDGENTGRNYYPMMSSRLHYFGGSSGHWGGLCSPLDELDFSSRDWVPNSGWPIQKADLIPYYKQGQEILDLGPFEYEAQFWQEKFPENPALPLDDSKLWNKIWQRSAPTRFGTKYKQDIVSSKNIHLYTYAQVTNLWADTVQGKILSAEVKNHAGKTHRVHAKTFILACSALQNARLLLASNQQIPEGIGNQHDLVGRYFMEHPEIQTAEITLFNNYALDFYKWNEVRVRAEIALSGEIQKKLKILNGTISLSPVDKYRPFIPNVTSWSKKDPVSAKKNFNTVNARKGRKGILERFVPTQQYHSFAMYSRTEQVPNPNSRLTLSRDRDALGMPKTQLHWELSELDKKTIRELNVLAGAEIGRMGLGRVRLFDFLLDGDDTYMPPTTSGGWHHIGTTRMHENSKYGVVNRDCRVHGMDNLYIAGSSCFPTSGASTPTLTVTAIALRLADHIKKIHNRLKVLV